METATKFQSDIFLESGDNEADAKSILGLMVMGLEKGSKVVVKINGSDEESAMKAVEELFDSNFGE